MRLSLLSLLLIVGSFVQAQQTYVPDDNFEAFLEGNGMGNGTPNDDYVTTANISGVNSLICGGISIADMTGIEDFTSLSTLYCFDNNLTQLDVTNCPGLSDLRCYNNDILGLDLSNCAGLSTLLCYNNSLTVLDVTNNLWLSDLSCYDNFLSVLDVTNNGNLILLICYDNQLASLDVTQNSNLTALRCHENQLTTLDASQCPSLNSLYCNDNLLTSLNVTQTSLLSDLRCYNNDLTVLDVTDCPALALLLCNDNELTSLDVTQNPALVDLFCHDNQLACLQANNGMNINLDCVNNPLVCATVVNITWAAANAAYDIGVTFDVACFFTLNNDVDQDATTLTAEQGGAIYQWLDCDDNYAVIDETGQSYSPLATGSFAVQITYTDPCGSVHVDTSSCHFHYVAPDETSIGELSSSEVELITITDLTGREVPFKTNTVLIYIYNDGTTKKVFKIE
ncbi:MAG: hypothetical protein HRT57_08560 [Crocinitomicaceae bacterium]|nr:hypothetical protein [Crocinitomicaceae bacterium]